MSRYLYTPAERETIIRWSDDRGEGVSIFTASPVIKRRLERRGLKSWKESRQNGHSVGWFYRYPYGTLTSILPRVKTPGKRPATAFKRAHA